MEVIVGFLTNYININVLILFLISSALLIFLDCREYKKSNMQREYKFAKYTAISYVIFGFGVYIIARMIRL